jgi:hypothetical protein
VTSQVKTFLVENCPQFSKMNVVGGFVMSWVAEMSGQLSL